MNNSIILTLLLLLAQLTQAQAQTPTPAPPQTERIFLMNGIAHIGNGKVIPNSIIGFENGKLTIIVDATIAKIDVRGAKVINIPGKHVYPGIIEPNNNLGLVEISAVNATRDYSEFGQLNPNVRTQIAYMAESKAIPTVRSNGVLTVQCTPRGGQLSGTSSIMQLDAWNWEDAVIKADDALHMMWPGMFSRGRWWEEPSRIKPNKNRVEQMGRIEQLFKEAKAYSATSSHEEKNLKLEAMSGLFDGSQRLFINVNYAREIIESVKFAQSFGVKNIVIAGGADSWKVADFLRANNIPIVIRVHRMPFRTDEDIDLPFKQPAMLKEAGVLFCLNYKDATGSRNLPFFAGTAAAYGLSKEEALESITLSTAKILGIDDQLGSLEPGKKATLFVSEGDALDMRTNQVVHAFIDGREIDLDNHQKQLNAKYKSKYEHQ